MHNGTDDASAGAGVHFPNGEYSDCTIRLPNNIKQSNQSAEIIAIKEAVDITDAERDLIIHSDSKTMIQGLTTHLQKWEDTGFMGKSNAHEIQATVASLRKRKAPTTLHWVKGHAGLEGNERADNLAMEGRLKETADEIDLTIDPDTRITGAKLKCIMQSLAQKFIRQKKMKTKTYQKALSRRITACGIGRAKACAKEAFGYTPTTEAIWKSIRHRDLGKKIRTFLWMLIHGGYKIGEYWEKIPGFENRATCAHCQMVESMEHILVECQAPGQEEVWKLTKNLWTKSGERWRNVEFGNILSCGLADFKDPKGKRNPGTSRLFRILISESAYLIWKLRCERVIGEKTINIAQITNQWTWSIESRLNLDCLLTSKKFSAGKVSKEMVKKTWGKLVSDQDQFFETLEDTGVLVSIRINTGIG
ncbi:hypothetical protein C8R41DRAFT_892509 [Lentinula lateritia]|uniref:ribonuclease H n=1 Tax=Lentinula lateritia TaxID=40482 RepID=A0ABQ8VYD7_9AGAR|nr:hypothetical protein C8R41DRAFT_892509 [Lentinula lateritia]